MENEGPRENYETGVKRGGKGGARRLRGDEKE